MERLIKDNEVMKQFARAKLAASTNYDFNSVIRICEEIVENTPAVDSIIHCQECIYWEKGPYTCCKFGKAYGKNFYCGFARKI